MPRTLPAVALAFVAILAGACGEDPTTAVEITPQFAKPEGKGGGNGGGGGGGGSDDTFDIPTLPAVVTILDGANLRGDGQGTYQDDGCVVAYADVGSWLYLFERYRGKDVPCERTVTVTLDRPHLPGHVGEEEAVIPNPEPKLVSLLNARVQQSDPTDDRVGRSKINGPDLCMDSDGRGLGLRLDPNSIVGSTRFLVEELEPGARWRLYTEGPENDIAGCVVDGDTTYWHVDMEFVVEVGG